MVVCPSAGVVMGHVSLVLEAWWWWSRERGGEYTVSLKLFATLILSVSVRHQIRRLIPEALLSPRYVLKRSFVHVAIPSSMRSASSLRPSSSPV